MSEEVYFGTAISAISKASGLSPELTAVTATVLGAIAGREAGITDVAGSLVHPGVNLIVDGQDSARFRRALDLILAPLEECQQALRDQSAGIYRSRAEALELTPGARDMTNAVLKGGPEEDFTSGASTTELQRRLQALRRPSFFLRNPDPAFFSAVLREVADGMPLVVYPDGNFLDSTRAKRSALHLKAIAEVVAGTDQPRAKQCWHGYGEAERIRATLLINCSAADIKAAVVSNDAGVQQLLRLCVMLDVPDEHRLPQLTLKQVQHGYRFYQNSVRQVLTARRSGSGMQFEADNHSATQMYECVSELRKWSDALPVHLRAFFTRSLSLPYQLLWTFRALAACGESLDWCVPAAIHTTRWMLERQRDLLASVINAGVADDHLHARSVMLSKLAAGPCMFRDLLRKYSVQRRDVHEPILQELLNESLVHLNDAGLLELTPEGLKAA